MLKYDIPLRVKISNREYDKLKDKQNKSKYVRDAINSYYGDMAVEIEYSKKEMIDEIKKDLKFEHDKFNQLIEEQSMQEERMISKLEKMNEECDYNLEKLEKERREMELLKSLHVNEKSMEEKIMEILPTLQGLYQSGKILDYDKIRIQAQKIKVTPSELKNWIESHMELVEQSDYKYMPRKYSEANGDEYKDFDKVYWNFHFFIELLRRYMLETCIPVLLRFFLLGDTVIPPAIGLYSQKV